MQSGMEQTLQAQLLMSGETRTLPDKDIPIEITHVQVRRRQESKFMERNFDCLDLRSDISPREMAGRRNFDRMIAAFSSVENELVDGHCSRAQKTLNAFSGHMKLQYETAKSKNQKKTNTNIIEILGADIFLLVFIHCSSEKLVMLKQTCRLFNDIANEAADLAVAKSFYGGFGAFLLDFGGYSIQQISLRHAKKWSQSKLLDEHSKIVSRIESASVIPLFYGLVEAEMRYAGRNLLQTFLKNGVFSDSGYFECPVKMLWYYEKTSDALMDIIVLQTVLYKIYNFTWNDVNILANSLGFNEGFRRHLHNSDVNGRRLFLLLEGLVAYDVTRSLIPSKKHQVDALLFAPEGYILPPTTSDFSRIVDAVIPPNACLDKDPSEKYNFISMLLRYTQSVYDNLEKEGLKRSFKLDDDNYFCMCSWLSSTRVRLKRGHGHISCACVNSKTHSFFLSGFVC